MMPYLGSFRRLGGVMVSVLAIGRKVRGFKSGRDNGFLTVIKIRNALSFGGGGGWIKQLVRCRKILRHVKITGG
jgi:hypothetical protein